MNIVLLDNKCLKEEGGVIVLQFLEGIFEV